MEDHRSKWSWSGDDWYDAKTELPGELIEDIGRACVESVIAKTT